MLTAEQLVWGEVVLEFFKRLYIFCHASGLKSSIRRMDLSIKSRARVSKSGGPKKRVCDLCTACEIRVPVDNARLGVSLEAATDCNGRSTRYPPRLRKLLGLSGGGAQGAISS